METLLEEILLRLWMEFDVIFVCLVWFYIDWAILLVVIRRGRCVNIPCNINDLSCCQLFQCACFTWLCHDPMKGVAVWHMCLSQMVRVIETHWSTTGTCRIILERVDAKIIITEVQFYCEAATLQAGTIPPDFILRVSNRGEKSSQGWVFWLCQLCQHSSSKEPGDCRYQKTHIFTFNVFLDKVNLVWFHILKGHMASHIYNHISYIKCEMCIYQLFGLFCSKAVTILRPCSLAWSDPWSLTVCGCLAAGSYDFPETQSSSDTTRDNSG